MFGWFKKKPQIIIEDFEEENVMSEDQPGVQSPLEIAAVEYVQNANQETLAKLRDAARAFVEGESTKKKAPEKAAKKPKK